MFSIKFPLFAPESHSEVARRHEYAHTQKHPHTLYNAIGCVYVRSLCVVEWHGCTR